MNRYEKMQRLKDADFKQIIGVKRETFTAMNEVLIAEYERKHEKGGRKPKLTVEEQLIMTLKFIMVDGYGDPNTGAEYKTAVEILYGLSYSIKMSKKSGDRPDGYFDYVVPPLEGLWWHKDGGVISDVSDKSAFA